MAITFDDNGKPAYMFKEGNTSDTGVWYAIGAKVDTTAAYEWTGATEFLNTVNFDSTVNLLSGFNNFLNPAARDAAITSPVRGTICFVRQDAGGNSINQIQYYSGSAWTANDGDISAVTAGTGLTGGGTAGALTLSVDTTLVATTSNTMTMTNKTMSGSSNTFTNIGNSSLTNSSITINGSSVSLGGSVTITGESFHPFMLMGA